jgi:hypothetical protein
MVSRPCRDGEDDRDGPSVIAQLVQSRIEQLHQTLLGKSVDVTALRVTHQLLCEQCIALRTAKDTCNHRRIW